MARFKFGHAGAGFLLCSALDWLVATHLKVALRYLGEGDKVSARVELREEEIAVFPEEGGHKAEFAGLLWRDNVATDRQRSPEQRDGRFPAQSRPPPLQRQQRERKLQGSAQGESGYQKSKHY